MAILHIVVYAYRCIAYAYDVRGRAQHAHTRARAGVGGGPGFWALIVYIKHPHLIFKFLQNFCGAYIRYMITDEEIMAEVRTKQNLKGGRPRVIPMKSFLSSLPTTKQLADSKGLAGIDFSLTAEVLAVLGAINLESALASDDVPIGQRVDWTLRMAPFLNQLRDGFKRKKGANLPKTTEALAEEASKRSESIKKLMAALGKNPDEQGKAAAETVLPPGEDDDETDTDD